MLLMSLRSEERSRILACIACHTVLLSAPPTSILPLHKAKVVFDCNSFRIWVAAEKGGVVGITALRTWALKNCLQDGTFSYSWSLELCRLVLTCRDTHFDCELSGVGFVSWLGRHWLSEEQTCGHWQPADPVLTQPLSIFSKTLTCLADFISYNRRLN